MLRTPQGCGEGRTHPGYYHSSFLELERGRECNWRGRLVSSIFSLDSVLLNAQVQEYKVTFHLMMKLWRCNSRTSEALDKNYSGHIITSLERDAEVQSGVPWSHWRTQAELPLLSAASLPSRRASGPSIAWRELSSAMVPSTLYRQTRSPGQRHTFDWINLETRTSPLPASLSLQEVAGGVSGTRT